MAWEKITHKCGHEESHQYYGKRDSREWKMSKDSEKLCSQCYKAQKEEESELSRVKNQDLDLPSLNGSEKQIAWAETIRNEKCRLLDSLFEERKTGTELDKPALDLIEKVKSNPEAKFWIDNRKSSAISLLENQARVIA